jgi:hypothetical protein
MNKNESKISQMTQIFICEICGICGLFSEETHENLFSKG